MALIYIFSRGVFIPGFWRWVGRNVMAIVRVYMSYRHPFSNCFCGVFFYLCPRCLVICILVSIVVVVSKVYTTPPQLHHSTPQPFPVKNAPPNNPPPLPPLPTSHPRHRPPSTQHRQASRPRPPIRRPRTRYRYPRRRRPESAWWASYREVHQAAVCAQAG